MESRFKNQSEKLNKKITAMIMAFMVTIVCLGTGISAEANTKAALEAPQITNCYIDGEYVLNGQRLAELNHIMYIIVILILEGNYSHQKISFTYRLRTEAWTIP